MKAPSLLFLSALLCLSISVSAQQSRTLKGVVTDENNLPLAGVNILIKGSQKATTTDAEGKYSIALDGEGVVLQVSYVGFIPKDVRVGREKDVNITLVSVAKQLSDVVVIGYGTAPKKDVTGSITTVKS